MSFFQRKKPQSINRQMALQCIPIKISSAKSCELESGEIIVEYPLPIKPLFQALYKRYAKENSPPTKKLQLDAMGSVVWQLIDGENSTQNIIKEFSKKYSITIQEAEQSVTAFLVELGKRGLVAMQ